MTEPKNERSITDILSGQEPLLPSREAASSPLEEVPRLSSAPASPGDAPIKAKTHPLGRHVPFQKDHRAETSTASRRLSRKKTFLLGLGGAALLLFILTIVLFRAPKQPHYDTFGAPTPQIEGLYWGMTREEAIQALNLEPGGYLVREGGMDARHSNATLHIRNKFFPTPWGTACDVSLTFGEDIEGRPDSGLYNVSLRFKQPAQELMKTIGNTFTIDVDDSRSEESIGFYLQSKKTLQSCVPEELHDGFLLYLANPKFGYKWHWSELGYAQRLDPQKASEYFDPLPFVAGSLTPDNNPEDTILNLWAKLPAELNYYANHTASAASLEWSSFFHYYYIYSMNSPSSSENFTFGGTSLQAYPAPNKKDVFERDFYFEGIPLPAKRITMEYTPYIADYLYGGSIEWPVSDAGQRQSLCGDIAKKLAAVLGAETEIDPLLALGILHQWDDDSGNHIYIQDDAAAGVVRVVAQAD